MVNVFAALGAAAVTLLTIGIAIDVANIDQTSGGYEAPFDGWTGTPIDWSANTVSVEGFRQPGLVMDILYNCTTGMISAETFGVEVNFRVLSERAVAIHKPVEACEAEGFSPDFTPTSGS